MASECPGCTRKISGATLYQHTPREGAGCGYVGCLKAAGLMGIFVSSGSGCMVNRCPKCNRPIESRDLQAVGSVS
jgi:hypothetical protein